MSYVSFNELFCDTCLRDDGGIEPVPIVPLTPTAGVCPLCRAEYPIPLGSKFMVLDNASPYRRQGLPIILVLTPD